MQLLLTQHELSNFSFSEETYTESEVDTIVAGSGTGYIKYHTKLDKIPYIICSIAEKLGDYLGKGGIDYVKKKIKENI